MLKVRQVRQRLMELGCKPDRISGSHELWLTPLGRTLPPFRVNYLGDDMDRMFLSKIKNALQREGLKF